MSHLNYRIDFSQTQHGRAFTYAELLDHAVSLYWKNRPRTPRCGSQQGYRQHGYYGTPACDPCKEAHRMYKAIVRLRAQKAAA